MLCLTEFVADNVALRHAVWVFYRAYFQEIYDNMPRRVACFCYLNDAIATYRAWPVNGNYGA